MFIPNQTLRATKGDLVSTTLRHSLLAVVILAVCGSAKAQLVVYGFGSAGSPTTTATSLATNLSASVFSGNAGSPATGSGAPQYTAGSGGSFFTASAWSGVAPGSNYFQFTLTPDAGYQFSLTSLSFGSRSTSTGPTAYAIRSSADAFASNLNTGTYANDGNWYSSGTISITLSGLTSATTFRIYGSGASSGLGTLRIDDVNLNGSVSAIPEPATYVAILGAVALAGVMIRRRKMPHSV